MDLNDYNKKRQEINNEIIIHNKSLKELKESKRDLKRLWNESKDERSLIKAQKKIFRKEKNIKINEPPHLTLLEEIGNAVTHGIGSIFAITVFILMLIYSSSIKQVIASLIYGICMIILFTMSCLYHSFKTGSKVKRVFRRFDYSSIYLLIGGTFTPILLLFLNNKIGLIILIVQWILISTGITFVAIFGPGRLKWLHFPLYFILGWLGGIMIIPKMLSDNISFFWWIISGGLVYTLGMIPFCFGTKKSAHFIWHFFVVAGAVIQWIGIFITLYI